ncbi:hypothetical protein PIB30_048444 [Stylosanthes scabra]|uniref:Disease resistance R13L4/SHOC-2-like LRR domain-containing protein n=1 Tax=Stylosanthes scabra TaxID=79078 RepID=A0ABU6WFH3_9FABA|nr:hypothetical protein [Stylosanthes scabra]
MDGIGWYDIIDIGVLDEETSASTLPSASSSSFNLQCLYLSGCENLKQLPDTFYKLTSLQELCIECCKELDTSNLHILFDSLSSLRYLDMSWCDKLYELPDNITNLSSLNWLALNGSNLTTIPESIKHLPHLKHLNLWNCKKLESLTQIPPSLHELYLDDCIMLERVFTPTPQLLQQHLAYFQSFLQGISDPYSIAPIYLRLATFGNSAFFSLNNCPKLKRDAIDAIQEYSERCSNGRREMTGGLW